MCVCVSACVGLNVFVHSWVSDCLYSVWIWCHVVVFLRLITDCIYHLMKTHDTLQLCTYEDMTMLKNNYCDKSRHAIACQLS